MDFEMYGIQRMFFRQINVRNGGASGFLILGGKRGVGRYSNLGYIVLWGTKMSVLKGTSEGGVGMCYWLVS